MEWRDLVSDVVDYFEEHPGDFNDCIWTLDGDFGFLDNYDGLRYYSMDTLDDFFENTPVIDILDAINLRQFDTSDSYWHYADYGIESVPEEDFSDVLTYYSTDFVTFLYNHRDDIWGSIPKYVQKLFKAFIDDYDDEDE